MLGLVFQDWVTLQGQGNASSDSTIIQSEPAWLDLGDFRDGIAWLDVRQWNADIALQLTYQTAPTKDEALFGPVVPPVQMVVGLTVTQMLSNVTLMTPLSRYLRWMLAPAGHTVTSWQATFRILIALNRPGSARRMVLPGHDFTKGDVTSPGTPFNGLPPPYDPTRTPGPMVKGLRVPQKQSPWIQK